MTCTTFVEHPGFYSASALLAMQSAVLAGRILSVRPSVRHVPVLCSDECDRAVFSIWYRIPLVSGEVKFIRLFAWDHPQWGR